jgi:hypothetical protein
MKLRHKETGEIINLPDHLPEYEDAKEIARVFQDARDLIDETDLPQGIVSLKTYTGEIIQVDKITRGLNSFPYEKLIRIHLHLSPFTNSEQQSKSLVWSVRVNGREWSVGTIFYDLIIEKFIWTGEHGWWAMTNGIYAIQLNKIDPETKNVGR